MNPFFPVFFREVAIRHVSWLIFLYVQGFCMPGDGMKAGEAVFHRFPDTKNARTPQVLPPDF